jgi:hypothetical protein
MRSNGRPSTIHEIFERVIRKDGKLNSKVSTKTRHRWKNARGAARPSEGSERSTFKRSNVQTFILDKINPKLDGWEFSIYHVTGE